MAEQTEHGSIHHLELNLERLHTTDLGVVRIKKNLSLETVHDVVGWCREKMVAPGSQWIRRGKNWYIQTDDCIITVNAYSNTIITAHRRKDRPL